MSIWFEKFTLDELKARGKSTMVEHLGIKLLELGDDFVTGEMPVDHRTKQPAGLLHGGASVAFAESLASIGAACVVDRTQFAVVGVEINANHIRSCTEGKVVGRASPLHLGRTTQVWEIKITQGDKLVCVSRITVAVVPKRK